jgi:vitamin B12 transporter
MIAFSSKRGRCAVACSIVCLAAGALAQTTADPIVVTGAREPLASSRLAADVVVISAETLRNSSADSLADVLRREAGVQLSRNGGPGQNSGILLRGASSQQTVLLVDGVRVGSATLGSASFEALGLSQIERVEVLRGPGSSLYGADAVGGVVQVFTKAGSAGLQGDVRVAVGGYASRELSGGLRGASGIFDYAASLSSESSGGVSALRPGDAFGNHNPDRDGYRLDSAHLRLGIKPTAGQRLELSFLRTRLNSQYDGSEFLPPNFDQDATPDFRTRLTTEVGRLAWRTDLTSDLTLSADASHSLDDSHSGANDISLFRTTRDHIGAQLAGQRGVLGQLVAALEGNVERASSSSYDSAARRRTNAVVLALTGAADGFSWQADARRDGSSDYGAVTTGRLGVGFAFAPAWRLRALAGNTFRAPSFNDLLFPKYGVPTLRPERGRSVEIGLNWQEEGASATATVYRNQVRDLIGYQSDKAGCPPDPAYAFGCAANVNRAVLQGATLAAKQRAGAWTFSAQLDALEARDADSGKRLARRAAHQETVGVLWAPDAWALGADLLRLGARPDGGKTLAAETTLNVTARWQVAPAWQLQAKLLNATDARVEPARDYQGLGRQAWLALRWEPVL